MRIFPAFVIGVIQLSLISKAVGQNEIDVVDEDWPGSIPYTLLIKPGGEIIYLVKIGWITY